MTGRMKLPTADWIGVGLAMVGMIGGVVGLVEISLVGLGVFGPSLLREMGWLGDGDEYTRRVMHRAGFHTMILLVALLTANRALEYFQGSLPEPFAGQSLYIPLITMVQASWITFAISYVVQYWGPRLGVSRVLFGFCGVMAAYSARNMVQKMIAPDIDVTMVAVGGLVIAGIGAMMALLVRSRPRAGGFVLLALLAVFVAEAVRSIATIDSLPEHVQGQGLVWAYLQGAGIALIVLAPLGVSLIRDRDDADE